MTKTTLFFLTLIAVLIAGCSGAGGKRVSLNMREFAFSPDTIQVTAGEEVTLVVKNNGALRHNFHILPPGSEVTDSWEEGDEANAILNHDIVEGGELVEVRFVAPTMPGSYQIVCSVPAHYEQGMHATLEVVAP